MERAGLNKVSKPFEQWDKCQIQKVCNAAKSRNLGFSL